MKKISLLYLIISIAVFTFFLTSYKGVFKMPNEVQAGASDNVYGWAWSENIGWISFNCDNPEIPAPRCTNDYGVNVDASGLFSGYAWSENIGWISFNQGELINCPSGVCEARLNTGTGEVSGWARACAVFQSGCSGPLSSNIGEWDGWIKLRGVASDSTPYGVSLNTAPDPDEFEGWVWGGDDSVEEAIVGWISFNCVDGGDCLTSDYKVFIQNTLPYIEPGTAQLDGSPEYCTSTSGVGQIGFTWIYQDNEGDNQSAYHLQVATDLGFNNLVVDVYANQIVSPGTSGTSGVTVVPSPTPEIDDFDIGYGSSYHWRVKVTADGVNWSTNWEIGPSFATPSHAYPYPDFSFLPDPPHVDEVIDFTDESSFYNGGLTWYWDFGDGNSDTNQNPSHSYSTLTDYTVTLTVTDEDTYSCSIDKVVPLDLAIPKWREIAPF